MTISATHTARAPRIRLGMVGGGRGAFIGAVHRIAARIDDQYELVEGCFSADPEKSAASAAMLRCSIPDDHIDPRRSAFFMARSVMRDIRDGVRAC